MKYNAQETFDYAKQKAKRLGIAGPAKIRVNRAGCLDRCAGNPVLVVYPDGIWYTYLDFQDIDEIFDSHLMHGIPVKRLQLDPSIGAK